MQDAALPQAFRRTHGQVCLVKGYSQANAELARLTHLNHLDYAGRWGYDVQFFHEPWATAKWGLWPWYLDLLDRYQMIFHIGSDVIITNPEIPLSHFADTQYGAVAAIEDLWDCGSPVNNDTLLVHNNAKGHEYLQYIIDHAATWTRDDLAQGLTRELLVSRPDLVTLKRMQGLPVRTSKVCWRPGDFTLHYLTATDAVKADRVRKYFTTGKICWYSDTRP